MKEKANIYHFRINRCTYEDGSIKYHIQRQFLLFFWVYWFYPEKNDCCCSLPIFLSKEEAIKWISDKKSTYQNQKVIKTRRV